MSGRGRWRRGDKKVVLIIHSKMSTNKSPVTARTACYSDPEKRGGICEEAGLLNPVPSYRSVPLGTFPRGWGGSSSSSSDTPLAVGPG